MAFCTTRSQFAVGWFGSGNQRRFQEIAATSGSPMGILASVTGEPAGWCACGPWSRYAVAISGRSQIMREHEPVADDSAWLVACFFVRREHRGRRITHTLLQAAIDMARDEGATTLRGWPAAGTDYASADAFLGTEKLFEDFGFRRLAQPSADRLIMILDLEPRGP